MRLVLLSANGLHFLIGWELYPVSSYLLNTREWQMRQVRAAGWLALAAWHAGTLCLFAFFALLAAPTGGMALGPMRDRTDLAPLFWLALAEVDEAAAWLWDASSVRARFEGMGSITNEQATDLGLVAPPPHGRVGSCATCVMIIRPAGIASRRCRCPFGLAAMFSPEPRVRWLETQRSGKFLEEQLAAPPDGPLRIELRPSASEALAVALVEGWRGETCHVALTNAAGKFRRYKIVDPSFHNWTGLALALRGQAISDFPLCNKSFNLSYCGFDL